jgi:hypothetical protein
VKTRLSAALIISADGRAEEGQLTAIRLRRVPCSTGHLGENPFIATTTIII